MLLKINREMLTEAIASIVHIRQVCRFLRRKQRFCLIN